MSGKFFEFKIKVASEDEAKNKLGSLTFGEPRVRDVIDTYLITSPALQKKSMSQEIKIFTQLSEKPKTDLKWTHN